MKRWNCETKKYEGYSIPANWQCGLYSQDFDKLTDCAKCGTTMKHSQKYKSLEVTDDNGHEYGVCKRCFKEEWVRKQMNIKKESEKEMER